jgi:CheY-like chemotaxis protein
MTDRYRVLHVDDDAGFLDLSAATFDGDDLVRLETATTPEAGLRALERDEVDCLVSDSLHTANGRPFVAAARDADPEVPILLFTGRAPSQVGDEILAADPFGYVHKGSSDAFGDLRDRLADLASREGPVPSRDASTRGGSLDRETGSDGSDGTEDDGWRVVAHHDFDADDEFAVTVIRAATHVLDDDPDERLYDVVDPESLERLLARSDRGTTVRFRFAGLWFEAAANGTIYVHD